MNNKICVIGTGYVGLVTGSCLADLGNQVIGADIDTQKILTLRHGKVPIYEPGLADLIKRNQDAGRLLFTTDVANSIVKSDIIFIAVGTPPLKSGDVDVSQVRAVAELIGQNLNGYKIIVNKSTVPVGMGNLVDRIIRKKAFPNQKFDVVSNPEFLKEGSAVVDTFNPDRIVIGAERREAAEAIADLYRHLSGTVVITDLRSAEMIKYASNAFLATRISFINEIANLCDALGADVAEVGKGMGLDKRIGPHFLSPGLGYGGSCFPKDTEGLLGIARKAGYHFKLLEATASVNKVQVDKFYAKISRELKPLAKAKIALWGLSFKPNTDDVRESQSLVLAKKLLKAKAKLLAYDPVGGAGAKKMLPKLKLASSAYAAAKSAHAVVVATEWNEFKQINLSKLKKIMARPLIMDGRNIYDPQTIRDAGFQYIGVGRPQV